MSVIHRGDGSYPSCFAQDTPSHDQARQAAKDLISSSPGRTPLPGSLGAPRQTYRVLRSIPSCFFLAFLTIVSPNKPSVLQILSQPLLPEKANLIQTPGQDGIYGNDIKMRNDHAGLAYKTFGGGRGKSTAMVLLSLPETGGESKLEFTECQLYARTFTNIIIAFTTIFEIDISIHISQIKFTHKYLFPPS